VILQQFSRFMWVSQVLKLWRLLKYHFYRSHNITCRCVITHFTPYAAVNRQCRAFPVAGPRIWNSLLQHVTSAPSLDIFHSRLKTHLFRRCFPWLHHSPVVPEKWHVITDTLIVFITYLLITSDPVSTRMSDRLWTGKPSWYVTSQLGRLSLLPSVGR